MFTGSTPVARLIDRTLAHRADNPVLIAETGGVNALIVDSTAQPEQVVADVLASAFDSAGQRCSALRVLCLQEEIADHVLEMLRGAMAELRVGDPRSLATDIGPVIDIEARDALLATIAVAPTTGNVVPPTLIEVRDPPETEIFGPILHVLRWRSDALTELLDRLNAVGYGLTHGIHSRIDTTIATITGHIHAGNVYVNRNIVGAVVGVQPFGGEGLSGTGPKAGGPFTLHRLVRDSRPPTPPLTELPGPTGERNVLTLHPRGRVLCDSTDPAETARQASAAQTAGCTVVTDRPDAILTDATGEALIALRRRHASDEGPIVPVISPDAHGYPSWRLLLERCTSINTTAAGGNAALMSAAE